MDQADARDDVEKAARLAQELGGAGDGMNAVWDRAHELTFAFLRIEEHWSAIIAVADELLRRRTLEHPEIQEIIEQHLGSRPAGSVSAARTTWDDYVRTGWLPSRTPNGLKGISLRGLTLNGLEVLEGSRPTHVEEVLAHAAVARATALAPDEVRELVLYGHPLAELGPAAGSSDLLA